MLKWNPKILIKVYLFLNMYTNTLANESSSKQNHECSSSFDICIVVDHIAMNVFLIFVYQLVQGL